MKKLDVVQLTVIHMFVLSSWSFRGIILILWKVIFRKRVILSVSLEDMNLSLSSVRLEMMLFDGSAVFLV